MNRMAAAAGFLAAAVLAAAAAEPPRPAWVDRFPHDPERYIGIGRAEKRSHPDDFREQALASALAQISREISVEITAAGTATRTEIAGVTEETYAGHVAAATRNALTGYTVEGVYETGEGFWAYYALDKEVWERGQADKARGLAAAMDRGLAEAEAEAEALRIQAAGERLERVRKDYAAALAADPILRDRTRFSADRLAAQSEKLASALRTARLNLSPGPWIFSLAAPGSEARAVLRDPDADRTWLGPLALRISEWPAKSAAECRVETDAEGRLDLAIPFQACGLASGTWRVAWTGPGPDGREFHAETPAEWRPSDVALAIGPVPAAAGAVPEVRAALPELRAALEGWPSRRYRIVAGSAGLPVLEVRIRDVTLDTLEGICFASIRASLIFPGSFPGSLQGSVAGGIPGSHPGRLSGRPGEVEAWGKAGHTDRGRALRRAAADFAREAALAADRSAAASGSRVPRRPFRGP